MIYEPPSLSSSSSSSSSSLLLLLLSIYNTNRERERERERERGKKKKNMCHLFPFFLFHPGEKKEKKTTVGGIGLCTCEYLGSYFKSVAKKAIVLLY